jgi:hypothetical protein
MRRLALIPLLAVVVSCCGSLARIVDMDIDPEGDRNCIESGDRSIPVAILGRAEFDVRQVDPGSVELHVPELGAWSRADTTLVRFRYVNLDAYEDLVLRIVLVYGSARYRSETVTLTGKLLDGTAIKGTDTVCVTGPGRYPYTPLSVSASRH